MVPGQLQKAVSDVRSCCDWQGQRYPRRLGIIWALLNDAYLPCAPNGILPAGAH